MLGAKGYFRAWLDVPGRIGARQGKRFGVSIEFSSIPHSTTEKPLLTY